MNPPSPEGSMPPEGRSLAERWNNKALFRLMWPLIIEQLFAVSIGLVDTVMVSAVGESAVSGVSLVDAVNILIITAFSALATGGAVVCSQYLGRREPQNASAAARQLVYMVGLVSLGLAALTFVFCRPLLRLIYGHIDPTVMSNAEVYLYWSAVSYPFIALYNSGAALFRSMGNSKVGMLVAFLVNVLNIGGNSLLIFGLGMGVAGAAISTLVSRAAAAVVLIFMLLRPNVGPISLRGIAKIKLMPEMIRRILRVGIPNGLETSVFQVGKLMVSRIISTFGTTAIAANAIAFSILSVCSLPNQAFGLAMPTTVGQCIGAGDYASAKRVNRKLMGAAWVSMLFFSVGVALLRYPLLGMFNLSTASVEQAAGCLLIFCTLAPPFWTPSFVLPNALRAAGDATYTMVVAIASMWAVRVGLSYVFAINLNMGVAGVWLGMACDWVVRSIFFAWRWLRGKWMEKRVI